MIRKFHKSRNVVIRNPPVHTYAIPKTALIISDNHHAKVRLVKACRLGGYVVHPPSTTDGAGLSGQPGRPDLILIDVPNDANGGLAWITQLRAAPETVTVPIIVTRPILDHEATVAALDAGADDVARRPGSFEELLARMRAVVRRRSPELAEDELSYGAVTIRPQEREVVVNVPGGPVLAKLKPTEFRLLHYLLTYPETIHSRAALRARLWSSKGSLISERTVDAHVKRLRDSLTDAGLEQSIDTMLNMGYMMSVPGGSKP